MKWGLGKWRLTRREIEGIGDEMELAILLDVLAQARSQLLNAAISAGFFVLLWLHVAQAAQDQWSLPLWKNVLVASICSSVAMLDGYLTLVFVKRAASLKGVANRRYVRLEER